MASPEAPCRELCDMRYSTSPPVTGVSDGRRRLRARSSGYRAAAAGPSRTGARPGTGEWGHEPVP
ncbi:hypothetical protein SSCG_05005 [Streptomyces clavuligerus]|nr:hypothetical protein SSCG_05005 [Streptomyces clavuligerus]